MSATRSSFSVSNLWSDSPPHFKGGIVVAVIAWFVSISSAEMTTVNGEVTACSYFDVLKVGAAVLIVGLAIAGVIANASSRRRKLPSWVSFTIAGVLVVVAALLLVQGLGVAMSPCQP